ncbi:FadR/GntR family transcriptional regulator [Pseudotabrizicola sp. 4114]|uniref:FadR/GntR family transcriptional regulator n=1 Tax=Pseudotabrizicola sp. 4114 TaxID=2817731 RepID=UPI00285B64B0|nr:DNA-binding FadR family transcriptional regulator [Pseudorhodobacter sp. 4114]
MPEADPAAIPRSSLRNEVYQRIYQKITRGDWPEGTRLPPETDLADMFNVSRPILREALMRLRLDKIIESRQGAGSRVINVPSPTVLEHIPAAAISDVLHGYEFRTALEGEAAYQAAQRAGPRHIADLVAAHQAMIETLANPEIVGDEEDIAFHMAVARATDNPHYVSAVGAIIQTVRLGVRVASTLPHWTRHERLTNSIREHHRLLDAIRDHNPDLARQLMRQHIEEGRKRVFLGQPQR